MEVIIMYLIGIDIAKYNHQCFIATEAGEVINEFSFDNNNQGFNELLKSLKSLDQSQQIKIGLEATGHYGNTLKQFISANGYTFAEFNPYLAKQFFKSTTIRKTKTDKVDARLLSSMLASVDYKALHTKYYHINELKALTRARDSLISDRSNYLVQITNALDIVFPEFKAFFNGRLGKAALFILNKHNSLEKISKMNRSHYDKIQRLARRGMTYNKFLQLKELAKNSIGINSVSHFLLINHYTNLINNLNSELDIIENNIYDIMSNIDTKLTTIPGVSLMSAAIILGEIGDINKFSSASKLVAYSGFDIAIYQSGESHTYGRLVKRGSPLLRKTIWNLVFGCIRLIPQITDFYYKKRAEGKHHKVAYSAISRKLIRLIYFIESTNTTFDISKYR